MDSTLSPHILFADSDALLCVTARRALQERGFVVTIAHDGFEALERFDQRAYAAVVLGLSLRLVDGVRALHEIKRRQPDLPIILVASPQADTSAITSATVFAIVRTPLHDWNAFAATLTQAIQARQTPAPEPAPAPVPPMAPPDVTTSEPFTLLHMLANIVRTAKPIAEKLDLLLQTTVQLLGTNHAALVLIEGDHLRLYSVLGTPAENMPSVQFDEGLVLRVATEQCTLIEPLPAAGNAKIIATPLGARDVTFGVLLAYPVQVVAPEKIKWLEMFALHGSHAIEVERLTGEFTQHLPTDTVTDVLRRAPFLELADREFRRAWRYNQPITAIVLSLDNLADLRATSGTFIADRALKLSAQMSRNAVRSIDLLCRYTDDTFAILLLMTARADARHVAERLRNGIAGLDIANGKGPLRLTASLGVSAYPRDGCSSIFDLLAIAQEAQRAAQHGGSNQIVYV